MDGFTGSGNVAGEELPKARAVMDPYARRGPGCRQARPVPPPRPTAITGRQGRKSDPLYRAGRTLRTRASLLTDAQAQRLENLFADERHVPIQATWGVYQRLIQAYRTEDPSLGKYLMQRLIDSLKRAIPDGLKEIQALARTLTERSADILAYFDRPGTSNGPTPSGQRTPRAPARHRPGIQKPHPLHHPQPHPRRTPQGPPDGNRLRIRLAPPTTPSNAKSRFPPRPIPVRGAFVADLDTTPPRVAPE